MFFFKQKTAYEMRISDWSSDVCSSDLSDAVNDDSGRCDCALPRVRLPAAAERKEQGDQIGRALLFRLRDRRLDLRERALGIEHELERLSPRLIAKPRGSEERRVGNEGASTWRSGWSPEYQKKNT